MNAFNFSWTTAPKNLNLSTDEVHIWQINLEQPEGELQSYLQTLSSDEVARAERFYFQQHRQRFIAGRGILRAILGRYLGVEPQKVCFDYQSRGKPILAAEFADSGLAFNLSHSQELGLCAVSCQREIGVDLEYIRPLSDLAALAERFFLPREYAIVQSLPANQQQEVFFRYWTCKEAYLKATGDGIGKLQQIEVFLTPSEPAKLLIKDDWSLVEILPDDNYRAAVVAAGGGWGVQYWQYEGEIK
jgi:4'-phosphopantetheinyl transferase